MLLLDNVEFKRLQASNPSNTKLRTTNLFSKFKFDVASFDEEFKPISLAGFASDLLLPVTVVYKGVIHLVLTQNFSKN